MELKGATPSLRDMKNIQIKEDMVFTATLALDFLRQLDKESKVWVEGIDGLRVLATQLGIAIELCHDWYTSKRVISYGSGWDEVVDLAVESVLPLLDSQAPSAIHCPEIYFKILCSIARTDETQYYILQQDFTVDPDDHLSFPYVVFHGDNYFAGLNYFNAASKDADTCHIILISEAELVEQYYSNSEDMLKESFNIDLAEHCADKNKWFSDNAPSTVEEASENLACCLKK